MTRSQLSTLEQFQGMMNVLDEKADSLARWQESALAEKRREIMAILSGERRK